MIPFGLFVEEILHAYLRGGTGTTTKHNRRDPPPEEEQIKIEYAHFDEIVPALGEGQTVVHVFLSARLLVGKTKSIQTNRQKILGHDPGIFFSVSCMCVCVYCFSFPLPLEESVSPLLGAAEICMLELGVGGSR